MYLLALLRMQHIAQPRTNNIRCSTAVRFIPYNIFIIIRLAVEQNNTNMYRRLNRQRRRDLSILLSTTEQYQYVHLIMIIYVIINKNQHQSA